MEAQLQEIRVLRLLHQDPSAPPADVWELARLLVSEGDSEGNLAVGIEARCAELGWRLIELQRSTIAGSALAVVAGPPSAPRRWLLGGVVAASAEPRSGIVRNAYGDDDVIFASVTLSSTDERLDGRHPVVFRDEAAGIGRMIAALSSD